MRQLSDVVDFRHDERWIESDELMSFTVQINGRSLTCVIPEVVLKERFLLDQLGRFQAFRENRREIEAAIRRRIKAGLPSTETLRLDARDFDEVETFIPWSTVPSPLIGAETSLETKIRTPSPNASASRTRSEKPTTN